ESVEAEGTGRFATFLENTGASGDVVHLSCEKALQAAFAAKKRGVRISVESVLPHFLLDKSYAERPGVEGMKHVMSPPLRAKHNQSILWNALAQGAVDTVGTDHCPFDMEQKLLGKDTFTNIPNGIPGIEDRVNLLYTYGVKRDRIDLDRFVDSASTRAAKLFGLFPRKGTIAVGSDGDLVIYDTNYRGVISAKTHYTNNDYNAFEGMPIEGRPSVVTVRGKVQVRDGKFVGERGRGKMLKREPTHFLFLTYESESQTDSRRTEGTSRSHGRRKRRAARGLDRHLVESSPMVCVESEGTSGRAAFRCGGK